MKFGSVCSGIEAASVAWEPLGWKAQWLAEIEDFPSAVLAERFPDIPNLKDMTKITETEVFNGRAIELLVGGTPCQSFSIAGLRKGLDDPRGNLALAFLGIVDRARPRWVVWENVPGVLSSWSDEETSAPTEESRKILSDAREIGEELGLEDSEIQDFLGVGEFEEAWQSNDFDTFTGGLRELGYNLAWRMLDAQHFGVPQRRRRVFVVGHLGSWQNPAAVLFERECLRGDYTKGGETRASVAALTATGVGTCGADDNQGQAGHLIAHTLRGEGFDASEDGTGRGIPLVPMAFEPGSVAREAGPKGLSERSPTLRAEMGDNQPAIVYEKNKKRPNVRGQNIPAAFSAGQAPAAGSIGYKEEQSPTLRGGASGTNQVPALHEGLSVRRLTPRECERLQGFPDDWTKIQWRGNPSGKCPDGPRYKAIGNSMAVPVMRWIGERIDLVEKIVSKEPRR